MSRTSPRSPSSKVHLLACAAALATAGVFAACSATNGGTTFGEGGGDASSGSHSSGSGGASGVGGNDIGDVAATSTGSGPGAGTGGSCAAESKTAEQLPLDMYIMLDQSGSMSDAVQGGTKWDAVKGALTTFVSQPGTTGIGVGLQYFPLEDPNCPASCATNADCGAYGPCLPGGFGCNGCPLGIPADSCVSADYAKPDVEIAPLPGVGAQIVQSMANHGPTGGTPTSAALQGAIDHATAWAQQHPDHVVVDLLATDGDPSGCDEDLNHIDAIAAAGANGNPKILTFVIGVGSSLDALNGIAQAGGTKQAFLVDTNQDVNQQFLDALDAIRGAALSCSYLIPTPEAGTPDYNAVNVQYTPGDGSPPQIFPKVADKASCPPDGDAWYYDDDVMPSQIIMCDATCNKISADKNGKLDILLGCQTIVK